MTGNLIIYSLKHREKPTALSLGTRRALQFQYQGDLLNLREIRISDTPTRSRLTTRTELSKLDDLQSSVTKYKRNVHKDYINL